MCKNSKPVLWDPAKRIVDTNYFFTRPLKKEGFKVNKKTKEESPKGKMMSFREGVFICTEKRGDKFMGRGNHVFYV